MDKGETIIIPKPDIVEPVDPELIAAINVLMALCEDSHDRLYSPPPSDPRGIAAFINKR